MEDNIITAAFDGTSESVRTAPVWRISRGMLLRITGLELPDYYQVHFGLSPVHGEAKAVLATSDTVEIPDEYLQSGGYIYAWVYVTPEEDVAYTIGMITIPVMARPELSDDEPTPEQASIVDQAIAALNESVGVSEQAAEQAEDAAATAQAAADRAAEAAAEAAGVAVMISENALIFESEE